MHGVGPRWEVIGELFETQCRRLGFNVAREKESAFRRPSAQAALFEPVA